MAFTQHEQEPPNKLIVRHPEFQACLYSEGELQMNIQMQKSYCHLKRSCIQALQGQITVPSDIPERLLPTLKSCIQSPQFGQLT